MNAHMRVIGLLGGMSWESSAEYYRIINEEIKKRLGGTYSGKIVLYSVNFEEIEKLQEKGDWETLSQLMTNAAKSLEKAGAEMIVMCTNTMHKVIGDVIKEVFIPVIHIADPTAKAIKNAKLKKIGLLGTSYTMEHDFYKGRLIDKHKIEVIIPNDEDRKVIHRIIFEELILGEIKDSSRNEYKVIIDKLKSQGAEGIILGCTEIGLLISSSDTDLPVFDTTLLHALEAVEYSLGTIDHY